MLALGSERYTPYQRQRQPAELLYAWRGGDVASGQQLFKRYYGPVARFFANKVSGDPDDLVAGEVDVAIFGAPTGALPHSAGNVWAPSKRRTRSHMAVTRFDQTVRFSPAIAR